MEQKELTPEQKAKLKMLMYSHMRNAAFNGAKVGFLLAFANILVCVANAMYVQNQTFVFIGVAMNAIFILPILSRDAKKEHDRVKEEAKKILEN